MTEYVCTLFYKGNDLGDYTSFEAAEAAITDWIEECEAADAKNRDNYSVLPIEE